MNVTGWSNGLEVTADGEGIVSHAGLALLRRLADATGLTGGLSWALRTSSNSGISITCEGSYGAAAVAPASSTPSFVASPEASSPTTYA